ncbi:hypothetical protein [Desulfosarcina ovata]|uniref:Uncharacterized protein n=1 Tax=Desulfosarcina ovata subsp. ovata TaxID=2752305 RepID=A0A5K8ABF4_9BACT|nr:hypothetical protein [Desulfosarcina ovata]BBO89818.1 hypothetical protein DSCOOX_29980 [Desulfosarcina ovata subsp. ovata]
MSRTRAVVVALIVGCIVKTLAGVAAPAQAIEVPAPLAPWKEWVLHGKTERQCPAHFDDGTQQRCWWPSRLRVNAGVTGGVFEQEVTVYAPTWMRLPGDPKHWPESVTNGEDRLPVTGRNAQPWVWLEPGDHRIRGLFMWNRLPERIQIPPAVGMVDLNVAGHEVALPELEEGGWLRLHGKDEAVGREDTFSATLFRLIEDDIPLRITTRILLEVSGRARDIRLPHLLPEDSTLLAIDSPLPARITDGNTLVLQGKPGRWDIRATVRREGPVNQLTTGKGAYGDEIWSFRAFHDLRMVKLSGAPAIEPSRTRMPDAWKGYPAYRMAPAGTLAIETIRRGDPDPAPDQLNLQRTWWLDFDGGGFTLHDRINGTLSRTWHLAMVPPMALGRVALDGEDQLITRQGEKGLPGVQLRRGRLALEADSRLPRKNAGLPAVGWDHDFQQVRGTLNLPPGWTLFSAAGVDVPPGAWLQQWTLLDFFLILVIAISTVKVRNRMTGLLALVTLVMIFHELGAPRLVWLHLLAVAALLKYLPCGWFRKLVTVWGVGAVVALVIISLPFMIQQVRSAIYPQLARGGSISPFLFGSKGGGFDTSVMIDKERTVASEAMQRTAQSFKAAPSAVAKPPYRFTPDPNALIQTGPGLPTWRWHTVDLRWNGPVDQQQQIRLWLISPLVNLLLGLARVALLILLIVIFLDLRHWRRHLPTPTPAAMATLVLLLLAPMGGLRAETTVQGFPPQPLLDELRQRLLEPPPCLPHCADISRLELTATPDQIRLILHAHALTDTAIPLPTTQEQWRPTQLTMDNEPVRSLARDDRGNLWMVLPQGVHRIKMVGPTGSANEIRIAFPIRPHQGTYAGVGWQARGFRSDGGMEAAVSLTRTNRDESAAAAPAPKIEIPAFFQITRTLHLSIQWEVTTHVKRLTRPGTPVLLNIPLPDGAAVTTASIQVEGGVAQLTLGPETMQTTFSASLPITPTIRLTAPGHAPWTETWILDAGTMWQCTTSGLTVVHHQDQARNWQPQWQPWPGETVTIAVTRPEAIAGRTLTIDSARLSMTPGKRFIKATLALSIRASKGGRHQIELPAAANLQGVTINGKSLPIRQDGQLVTVPIEPGRQAIEVQWLALSISATRLEAPRVHVGGTAVNATMTMHMPAHRWILFAGGPQLGPAVLFWSYVIVVLVAGVGLGKTTLTPLRTHHWMLLGLGLTQVPAALAAVVVGWLLALGARCRKAVSTRAAVFNLGQVLLVLLTLAALAALYSAIERGLLGIPDMQISGNGSTRFQLNWTQDRIDGLMPMAWVISLPQWVYHLLMLLWSLWLAFSLMAWLRWGWGCFAKDQLWKPLQWRRKRGKNAPTPSPRENAETES